MSENIALIQNKQKNFIKTVKKTKSKIKKGQIKIVNKVNRRSQNKIPIEKTGFLYISNIPHGFYEKQLKGYFTQFGNVIKVRVARSKKTGNSKGHAFIQFAQEDVAKIAAETMNNYLMGNRLLKAKLLPHDEKTKNLFNKPNFSKEHYPTKVRQMRFKKSYNAQISDEQVAFKAKNSLKHIDNVVNKLKKAGIDYDFKPVDVPKILAVEKKEPEVDIDDSSSEDIVFTSPEEMDKRLKNEIENKVNTTPRTKKSKIQKKLPEENKENKSSKNSVTKTKMNIKKEVKQKKSKSKKNETLITSEKSIIKKDKVKNNPKSKKENKTQKPKKSSAISDKKANLMVQLIKTSDQVKKVNKIEKKKNKTK